MFRQRLLPAVLFALGVGIFLLLWPARRLRSENLVVYLPNQCKLIPIQRFASTVYLPLLPLLNLRGPVAGIEEKRNSLKVWVGGSQLQFHLNSGKVQLNNSSAVLREPVLRVNGEWMVPVSFLSGVFAQLTGAAMTYEPGSNRAFLGGVHPISYAVRLQTEPSGAQLVIQFTGPVTAESASRNGKWLVFLRGAAVQPLEPIIRFNDPYVKELQFDDQDGQPKLIITPGEPNLNFYPVLTADRRELALSFKASASTTSTAPGPVPPEQSPLAAPRPGSSAPKATSTAPPAPPPPPPLPVIVLDAGHGGPDSGARSKDGILEKNLVASLVAQVSTVLQASQKFRIVLCRAGDSDPSIEDRTATANTARPAAFLTFHAGNMGSQSPAIRVYIYQPSDPAASSGTTPVPPLFVPWESAQMSALGQSNTLAADLAQRFSAITGATATAPMGAPVRQLRSITAPAVAIELGSLSPAVPAGMLNQPAFQQQVAKATALAIEAFVGGPAKP